MESENNPRALVAELVAAQSLGRPTIVNGIAHAVVPHDYALKSLEHTMGFPARNRGNFDVLNAEGFTEAINLVRKEVEPGPLAIFFRRSSMEAKVVGVVNFDTWRDLTVTLTQRLSDPFKQWFAMNGQATAQRKFALFLEERTHHVVKPDGAALLELCSKFKANVSVRYQSVIESPNGDSALEYIQTTEAGGATAKSRMKVPERITLQMPVWHGGEAVKFEARFGYSIADDGKLSLSFEIMNLDELLAVELLKIVNTIAKEHDNCAVIEGANCPVPAL